MLRRRNVREKEGSSGDETCFVLGSCRGWMVQLPPGSRVVVQRRSRWTSLSPREDPREVSSVEWEVDGGACV